MADHYRKYTKLDLDNRKTTISETFFNCAEYLPFLAICQLSTTTEKLYQGYCLTITTGSALQMCKDCRNNANVISKQHHVQIIDCHRENILIETSTVPIFKTPDVSYVSSPLKLPYAIMSFKEEEN